MKHKLVFKKKYLTRKRQHNKIKTKYLRKSIKKYPKKSSNNIKKTKKLTKNVPGLRPIQEEMLEPKTTSYANASSLSTPIYGGIKPSEIELSAADLGINFKPEVVPAVNKSLKSINNSLNYIVKLAIMPDPPPDDIDAIEEENKILKAKSSQKKTFATKIGNFLGINPAAQSKNVEIDYKTAKEGSRNVKQNDQEDNLEAEPKQSKYVEIDSKTAKEGSRNVKQNDQEDNLKAEQKQSYKTHLTEEEREINEINERIRKIADSK